MQQISELDTQTQREKIRLDKKEGSLKELENQLSDFLEQHSSVDQHVKTMIASLDEINAEIRYFQMHYEKLSQTMSNLLVEIEQREKQITKVSLRVAKLSRQTKYLGELTTGYRRRQEQYFNETLNQLLFECEEDLSNFSGWIKYE